MVDPDRWRPTTTRRPLISNLLYSNKFSAFQTAGKQQERSIIKRMTIILSSDGGLKEILLKLTPY